MKLVIVTLAVCLLVGCANFTPGQKEASYRADTGHGHKLSFKLYNKK